VEKRVDFRTKYDRGDLDLKLGDLNEKGHSYFVDSNFGIPVCHLFGGRK
jgi:hypothetical protein